MEELGNDGFLPKSFATPPQEVADTTQTPTTDTTATEATTTAETPQPPQGETKGDEFIDNFNKRFSSSFTSEDDIRGLFGLRQKVGELEPKLTDYSKKLESYEQEIENLKNSDNTGLLSNPLIRNAYVASQLLEKYPDRDPSTLQEIVMADVSKMSDFDVLVKDLKMDLPNSSEADIRATLCDKYGVDGDSRPEEWSSIAKTKIAIDARTARANIKNLTSGIQLPKAVSKEDRERLQTEALNKRMADTAPLKEEFTKFDKFNDKRIEGFEFDVPNDYKSKLNDMFQAMFVDAGMEPTAENKEAVMELRDALLLKQELPKIWDIAFKKGQVSVQKKVDEELSNTKPPNTTTKTDIEGTKDDLPGPSLSAFFANNR